jgi:hypothetical protein
MSENDNIPSVNVADLINSIQDGTLSDSESTFNQIMDIKVGEKLDALRTEYASDLFDDGDKTSDMDNPDNESESIGVAEIESEQQVEINDQV